MWINKVVASWFLNSSTFWSSLKKTASEVLSDKFLSVVEISQSVPFDHYKYNHDGSCSEKLIYEKINEHKRRQRGNWKKSLCMFLLRKLSSTVNQIFFKNKKHYLTIEKNAVYIIYETHTNVHSFLSIISSIQSCKKITVEDIK